MTDHDRRCLLTACTFARVFMEAADLELRGGDSSWRIEAAPQLQAALRNLELEAEE